jgi:hypothetical protein
MNARSTWSLAAVAVVAAAVALFFLWPRDPGSEHSAAASKGAVQQPERPRTPPVPGRDEPRGVPMPTMPPQVSEMQARILAEAKARGDERPGEKAFRATVDAFMEYNRHFAEAQAKEEGITVKEVGELTYFGFMVMQTQRWGEIEELVGHELSEDERALGEELMHTINGEFKAAMRKLVADDAPEAARWKLIRDTQERYLREYYALTGMTPALLDDLLAGDLSRSGAPIATPPPEHIEPAPAPAPVEPRPTQTP